MINNNFLKKTGTTIVGLVYNNGIIIGSDTQCTLGSILMDCNTKIDKVNTFSAILSSGSAAGGDILLKYLISDSDSYFLDTGQIMSINTLKNYTVHLLNLFYFKNIPLNVAPLLAGYDPITKKGKLFSFDYIGSYTEHKYWAYGSGMMYSIGVLSEKYTENISRKDAIALVKTAIRISKQNDIYSGLNTRISEINNLGYKILE